MATAWLQATSPRDGCDTTRQNQNAADGSLDARTELSMTTLLTMESAGGVSRPAT
jgi:hypothetical protein